MVTDLHIAGELECWPSKDDMAELLSSAGLNVTVGRYSLRVNDCEHFEFQEYGGDLGNPTIDANAETLPKMLVDAGLVSNALATADIRHRFEIYAGDEYGLVGYLHHNCRV